MTTQPLQTVLVVDDALTIRAYHKALLEELGLQALEAENGMEALEKVVEQPLCLCLVDVNMPLMDGFTFVRQLREGDRNADCPVIMITTESRASEEARGYQAGANLYLVKPADPRQLQALCHLMISPEAERANAPDSLDAFHNPVVALADAASATDTIATPEQSGLQDYFSDLMSE